MSIKKNATGKPTNPKRKFSVKFIGGLKATFESQQHMTGKDLEKLVDTAFSEFDELLKKIKKPEP